MFPQDDVRQIAYMNKVHAKMYYGFEMHEIYRLWIINPHFYKDVLRRIMSSKSIKEIRRFSKFYLEFIPHTEQYNERNIQKTNFDTIVLGSDILWDYSIPFYDHDKYVFGINLNAERIISYAASFGTVKPDQNHPQYVLDGIRRLDAISVRDSNSAMISENITGYKAKLVLDPTMLWNFNTDENIELPDIDYKYIVVYGSFFDDDQIAFVKHYCKQNNLKIVYLDSVGDRCDWCDVFIEASTINPFQWCGYIKNSEYLMTCTFHGLMFGLIFHKRILFNATQFMRDKSTEFINYLGLSDVLLSNEGFDKKIDYDWDYKTINDLIEIRRRQSLEFLTENK